MSDKSSCWESHTNLVFIWMVRLHQFQVLNPSVCTPFTKVNGPLHIETRLFCRKEDSTSELGFLGQFQSSMPNPGPVLGSHFPPNVHTQLTLCCTSCSSLSYSWKRIECGEIGGAAATLRSLTPGPLNRTLLQAATTRLGGIFGEAAAWREKVKNCSSARSV